MTDWQRREKLQIYHMINSTRGILNLTSPGPQRSGAKFWNIAGLSAVATLRDARLRGDYATLQRMPRRIL